MKSVVIQGPGAGFTVTERPLTEPGAGAVRIKVAACGVCHSDSFIQEGHWPGLAYPRVPGHEVAGVVDAVGPGVTAWAGGDRGGTGWHGRPRGHSLARRSLRRVRPVPPRRLRLLCPPADYRLQFRWRIPAVHDRAG